MLQMSTDVVNVTKRGTVDRHAAAGYADDIYRRGIHVQEAVTPLSNHSDFHLCTPRADTSVNAAMARQSYRQRDVHRTSSCGIGS